MKQYITLSLLALASLALAQANDAPSGISPESIGDLPSMRKGVKVETQQSPYGLPERKEKVTTNKTQYSQEAQIREILGSLPVTGVIGQGKKVLLYDITLEEGEIVPNVLRGQTEVLLVKEITPEKIYIEWIEKIKRKTTRTMEIPIDMSSRIEAIIPGQPSGGKKVMGIVNMGESEEDQ